MCKSFTFRYTFVLANGVKESYTNTSDSREDAEKSNKAVLENFKKAAESSSSQKGIILIQPGLAVLPGKVISFWVGGIKEEESK